MIMIKIQGEQQRFKTTQWCDSLWNMPFKNMTLYYDTIRMFPKIGARGTLKWMVKIMENPIKMDGLGVALFLETSMQWQYERWTFFKRVQGPTMKNMLWSPRCSTGPPAVIRCAMPIAPCLTPKNKEGGSSWAQETSYRGPITLFIGVISPQLPIYLRPFIGVIYNSS